MKLNLENIAIFFLAMAGLAACQGKEPVEELRIASPEAEFTITGAPATDVVDIDVDSTLSFVADITNTDVYTCSWSIDEETVSELPSFIYTFVTPGSFDVKFLAANEKGRLEKNFTVNVAGVPLEVEYSCEADTVSARIGETVELSVTVLAGDKNTVHSWKIDGEELSSSNVFAKSFDTPGKYTLNHFAINRDSMTASRSWVLDISDLPLEVTFTPKEQSITSFVGDVVNFSAAVTSGVFGVGFAWTVDGAEAGTDKTLEQKFDSTGEHKVAVKVTNAQGDSASNEWTVEVSERPVDPGTDPEAGTYIFDDFESSTVGVPSAFYIGNSVGGVNVMKVVDNPYKTASNSSSKVLVDEGSLITWSSSAYFKFTITARPDGTEFSSSERAGYNRLRVKIWVGESGFTPLLQEDSRSTRSTPSEINGVAFDTANPSLSAWNAAIKTNDWNVFVYDLTGPKYSDEVANFAATEQLQFRVAVDFNNNGKMPKDIYFDDITFLANDYGTGGGSDDPGTDDPGTDPGTDPSASMMFDSFEASVAGVSTYYEGNAVGGVNVMKVVDNPYKTSVNSSSKVLVDEGSLITWSSSAYFKFKIDTKPDGTALSSEERAKYTKVRVKVWVGDSGFTPLLQEDAHSTRSTPSTINGVAFDTANPSLDAWNAAIKTDDWNVFVYDLTGPKYSSELKNCSGTDQLQFRVAVDFNNSGKMPKNVYFDDIEFVE